MTEMRVEVIDGKMVLPMEINEWLQPGDELVAFIEEENTLIIKRLRSARLSQIAQRAPNEPEMPLEDIAAEVNQHRKEKRHASGS